MICMGQIVVLYGSNTSIKSSAENDNMIVSPLYYFLSPNLLAVSFAALDFTIENISYLL